MRHESVGAIVAKTCVSSHLFRCPPTHVPYWLAKTPGCAEGVRFSRPILPGHCNAEGGASRFGLISANTRETSARLL